MYKVLVSILVVFLGVFDCILVHQNFKIELQSVAMLQQVADATDTIKKQKETIDYQQETIMKQNDSLMGAKTVMHKQMGTLQFVSDTLNQCMNQNKELKVIAGIR